MIADSLIEVLKEKNPGLTHNKTTGVFTLTRGTRTQDYPVPFNEAVNQIHNQYGEITVRISSDQMQALVNEKEKNPDGFGALGDLEIKADIKAVIDSPYDDQTYEHYDPPTKHYKGKVTLARCGYEIKFTLPGYSKVPWEKGYLYHEPTGGLSD